jgi:hypothetical protein
VFTAGPSLGWVEIVGDLQGACGPVPQPYRDMFYSRKLLMAMWSLDPKVTLLAKSTCELHIRGHAGAIF